MNKKKVLVLSILIGIIVIVAGISVTYAYWASTHVSNSNIVTSGCLNIEYKDLSQPVELLRTYPGDDSDFGYYEFGITNKCDTPVYYDVILETLEGSDLNSEYINAGLEGYIYDGTFDNGLPMYYWMSSVKFADVFGYLKDFPLNEKTLDNSIYASKLLTHSIKTSEKHIFAFYTYLDDEASLEDAQEKSWNGKIVVNSTMPESFVNVTFDSNGGENNIDNKVVYTSDTYGELPTPIREGYTFKYWYIDDDESKAITSSSLVDGIGDKVLKAKWINSSYKSILDEFAFKNKHNYDVEQILPYLGVPTEEELVNANRISFKGSDYPTYTIYDANNKILYYYSEANIYITREVFGSTSAKTIRYNLDGTPQTEYVEVTGYRNVENIDLSLINTSLVTDMSKMFYGLYYLKSLNVSNFDTSNVTGMSEMFEYCQNLNFLDLSSFDTSKVTDFRAMFAYCYDLNKVDMSNFSLDSLPESSFHSSLNPDYFYYESQCVFWKTDFVIISDNPVIQDWKNHTKCDR